MSRYIRCEHCGEFIDVTDLCNSFADKTKAFCHDYLGEYDGKSQTQDVLKYMKLNNGITNDEARYNLGCGRLSARILELRKAGYNIETKTITVKNRYGKPVSYAKYVLGKE